MGRWCVCGCQRKKGKERFERALQMSWRRGRCLGKGGAGVERLLLPTVGRQWVTGCACVAGRRQPVRFETPAYRSRLCQTSSRAIECWASALAATLTGVCKHRAGRNQFALQPLFWDRAYLARDSPLALFTALPRGRAQSAIHSHPRTPPPD